MTKLKLNAPAELGEIYAEGTLSLLYRVACLGLASFFGFLAFFSLIVFSSPRDFFISIVLSIAALLEFFRMRNLRVSVFQHGLLYQRRGVEKMILWSDVESMNLGSSKRGFSFTLKNATTFELPTFIKNYPEVSTIMIDLVSSFFVNEMNTTLQNNQILTIGNFEVTSDYIVHRKKRIAWKDVIKIQYIKSMMWIQTKDTKIGIHLYGKTYFLAILADQMIGRQSLVHPSQNL